MRLVLRGRRAAGVEFQREGAAFHAEAAGEVILATGAVGSPHLLQLSGIGPGGVLRPHGIETAHDLPGVGENLQDNRSEERRGGEEWGSKGRSRWVPDH